MEQHRDRPIVGQRATLKGGDMEFVVSRIDDVAQTVDLTPPEQGFSVAKNVPFGHLELITNG
jgi:hypothetical protein